ncbi:MAG: HD domain-containing protein [Acidobacteriota bacterium]|nr:HD domain-containing protein [Acidobacteriota bacterium]MDH3529135.1 HD domain-containing protein [Acidobacteriota bacterium]
MDSYPDKVLNVARAVRDSGGRAMLVGGCVRDELMGVPSKDWDIEVYGIEPAGLKPLVERFGSVNAVGEAFTVYKLDNDVDLSIPRRERKVARGHKGFIVEGDPGMSFAEASKRRDFTVNSILKDILTGEIVDPYNGRPDIEKKVLRMVSKSTFGEDSLRVLRAARFAATLEFDIEHGTVEVCKGIDLSDLPSERIWGEIEKLLLESKKPSIGLKWIYDLGIADRLFPEMTEMIGVAQEEEWHPEGDVDVHTLLVVDEARRLIDDLPYAKRVTVMLGALCHDFGKPATTDFVDGRIRSLGHDEAGIAPTLSFLDRLNLHTLDGYDVRRQVVALVRDHLKPGMFYKARDEIGDGAFRRLARKVEPDLLYRVAKADSLGRNAEWIPREKWFDSEPQEWFLRRVRELEVEIKPPEPILKGRHLIELGLEPSKDFGRILDAVYELQTDGKIKTLDEAIAAAKELMA